MAREFTLPDLGEGITEAQVVRLLVQEGEHVDEDQYLMEVETDKAAVEIPSPYSGIARTIHVQEGQTVNVGEVIVTFDDGDGAAPKAKEAKPAEKEEAERGEKGEEAKPARDEKARRDRRPAANEEEREEDKERVEEEGEVPSAEREARPTTAPAAPAVRKLARELGVDLDRLSGSGPGGRITKEDVERQAQGVGKRAAKAKGRRTGREPAPAPPGVTDKDKWGAVRRVPLSQIRKTIANQMTRSAFSIPHVTHVDEADITTLDRMRRELNAATENDARLTMMSFVIRATCLALRRFPVFNASFDEEAEAIVYKEYVNMGVAVDTERGLIVPVIRDADQLGLAAIASELRSIAERIRSSQFGIEDLRGGSFTITNVGALGGLFSTPLINYPEVAILGLGRSRTVPVMRNGEVQEAMVLPMCVSFDHRATDGANAARFTREIISYLEMPAKFLLD